MSNIIRAVFSSGNYTTTAVRADRKPIWQWNYGQILQLHGLDLPKATEVHFSHSNISGDALIRIGTTTDKITEVAIPESFLEHSGKVTAYVYCSTVDHGQTEYKTYFRVEARAKPEAWDKPEDAELFHEAIEAVNEAAGRAETAAGNAAASAEAAHTDAGKTAADRTVVEQCKTQAAKSAENALQSEKDAGLSREAARVAQGQAELYARQTQDDAAKTAADRVATGRDREAVAQDKTVANGAAERAESAEGNIAGMLSGAEATITELLDATTQGNMTTSGLDTAIKTAETSNGNLTDTVTAADAKKQELDGSIATATVKLDSLTQQNTTASTNIEALRSENFDANEILTAVGEIKKYANAITGTAQGTTAVIHDTWAAPILDLGVCGKSVQDSTTGAQLLNPDLWEDGTQSNGVTFTELEDGGIKCDGVPTLTPTLRFGEYIDILQDGKTYSFNSESTKGSFQVKCIDGKTVYIRKLTVNKTDITNIIPYLQWDAEEFPVGGVTVYPMLNEGDTVLPWEPYTGGKPSPSIEYPHEIQSIGDSGSIKAISSVGGRNLLRNTKDSWAACNIGQWYRSINEYPGEYNDISGFGLRTGDTITYSLMFNGGQYGAKARITLYSSTTGDDKTIYYGTKVAAGEVGLSFVTITLTDTMKYISLNIHSGDTTQTSNVMKYKRAKLEKGNKATDWSPAPEDITPENAHQYRNLIQPVIIPLTEPLRSTGKYADRICKQDGMWGIERQCIESAPITIPSGVIEAGSNTRKVSIANVFPVKAFSYEPFVQLGFSTHFKSAYNALDTSHFYVGSVVDGGSNFAYFFIDTEDTVENVVVVAVRMTPVFEPFDEDIQEQLNALESYGGTTVLYTTDPMEPEVTFTCVKDSNRVIENLETQHAEDIIDLQAQIDALTAGIG